MQDLKSPVILIASMSIKKFQEVDQWQLTNVQNVGWLLTQLVQSVMPHLKTIC